MPNKRFLHAYAEHVRLNMDRLPIGEGLTTRAASDDGGRGRRLVLWCWWIVPAILSANALYLRALSGGKDASWTSTVIIQLLVWSLWLGFTPLVLSLGRRVPIANRRWWKGVLFHAFASVLLTLAYLGFYTLVLGLVGGASLANGGFAQTYAGVFIAVFHWDVMIYWTILGAGYAMDYYDELREREVRELALQKQLVAAQLESLRAQLQPHFLFNALHTIGSLIRQDRKGEAVSMLAGLSDLLRMSLDTASEQDGTLREELEFVRQYLEIQRARFQDRLDVHLSVPPNALDARLPRLLLQPIVENAIRHGFDKTRDSGRLEIRATRDQQTLILEIYNDGPNLPPGWKIESNQGVGLRNTRERLRQLYGECAAFELRSGTRGGVEARLSIPQEKVGD